MMDKELTKQIAASGNVLLQIQKLMPFCLFVSNFSQLVLEDRRQKQLKYHLFKLILIFDLTTQLLSHKLRHHMPESMVCLDHNYDPNKPLILAWDASP